MHGVGGGLLPREEWGEEQTRGSAGLETPRVGLKVPTDDFRNTLPHAELLRAPARARATPANAAWRDSAPKPQPCATLDTHSKKSSRSGGYLPKSAVRFLAASSLARQDSWAESGLSCQYQGSETPLHPGTPPVPHAPSGSIRFAAPIPTPAHLGTAQLRCFVLQTLGKREDVGSRQVAGWDALETLQDRG